MLLIDWIHYIVSFIGEDRGEKYLLVDWKIASMPIHTRGLGIRKLLIRCYGGSGYGDSLRKGIIYGGDWWE